MVFSSVQRIQKMTVHGNIRGMDKCLLMLCPYWLLRNNQEYMVKAMLPDGIYTKVSFRYQCPVPTQYLWVSGGLSTTELSCDPPDNTLLFSGNTYVAPAGTVVQLKLLNAPDSGTQDLPPDGILIGSTNIRNDGSYEYRWNGDVPGYRLKNGQEYTGKALFPDSGLSTAGSFRYVCTGTNAGYWISGRLFHPVRVIHQSILSNSWVLPARQ